MNYFELHIGDYEKATSHLTAVEDGIYSRMVRRYYDTELPLPIDIKSLQRFVRARSRDEREAVQTILDEFFYLATDGWHNKRCDEEIVRFRDKSEKAKRSADARWSKTERNANASPNAMRTHSEGNAHQTPSTSNQTPDSVGKTSTHPESSPRSEPMASGVCESEPLSPVIETCIELRKRGFRITPQNPELIAAIAEGVTPAGLVAMADSYPGKPSGYVISACRRQLAEGATALPAPTARAGPSQHQPPQMGKTAQAIQRLEDLKNGTRLAIDRDRNRHAEAAPAIAGTCTGS